MSRRALPLLLEAGITAVRVALTGVDFCKPGSPNPTNCISFPPWSVTGVTWVQIMLL